VHSKKIGTVFSIGLIHRFLVISPCLRKRQSEVSQVERGEQKAQNPPCESWEAIAENLSEAGWSLRCVSAVDSEGRTIWIVDAQRDDGRRFVVHADEKLSAFVELERQVLTVTFYLASIRARDQ
jgi:hypothetical protein